MPAPIVRTSDRNQFRKCREKWNFTSKIREDWEYVPGIEPLDFGIACHTAWDVYYDPRRWNEPRGLVQYESIHAFIKHLEEWKVRLQKADQWALNAARWSELMELGIGMLEHYFMWAPKNDTEWVPIKSEIEFEVPIPVPDRLKMMVNESNWNFRVGPNDQLQINLPLDEQPGSGTDWEWVDVLYQGRIDLIVQFPNGKYGLVDHKTAAQFGQTEHLELDTQTRSYAWALKKMLGIDIERIIYNEARKAVPSEPRVLKSGFLSKAKNQGTTVQLYEAKIKQLNHDPSYYADFLPVLEANQTQYFRRTEVTYSRNELAATERAILMEAIDMLNDPFIYPNPDRWNCNGCPFRTPCLLKQEGGDYDWHLRNSGLYIRRGSESVL